MKIICFFYHKNQEKLMHTPGMYIIYVLKINGKYLNMFIINKKINICIITNISTVICTTGSYKVFKEWIQENISERRSWNLTALWCLMNKTYMFIIGLVLGWALGVVAGQSCCWELPADRLHGPLDCFSRFIISASEAPIVEERGLKLLAPLSDM